MKKLLIAAILFTAVSCTKNTVIPKEAHVYGTTYFLFPGATVPVVGAIVDIPLKGDSATVEYKGSIYRVPVVYQVSNVDTSAHVIDVKDVNGYKIFF